jgi:hypothetical protein
LNVLYTVYRYGISFFCEKGILLSTFHSTSREFYNKHPGSTRKYNKGSPKLIFNKPLTANIGARTPPSSLEDDSKHWKRCNSQSLDPPPARIINSERTSAAISERKEEEKESVITRQANGEPRSDPNPSSLVNPTMKAKDTSQGRTRFPHTVPHAVVHRKKKTGNNRGGHRMDSQTPPLAEDEEAETKASNT